ncbi:MAG TPA: PRC-barrel domain-containing protein [Micropepsaceae bacterium]|nr:PRC-barrel domain-containing protein [Micropepsaceae bacterium]
MATTTTQTGTNKDREIPREETANLIASDKVEGTAVYGADRKKIGRIENLMIDKWTGQVAYAVLSFGGFFGAGSEHYPLPWSMLKYDEELGGYVTPITKDQLKNAPKFGENETWEGDEDQIAVIENYYIIAE